MQIRRGLEPTKVRNFKIEIRERKMMELNKTINLNGTYEDF
jgi:hypothetical protein